MLVFTKVIDDQPKSNNNENVNTPSSSTTFVILKGGRTKKSIFNMQYKKGVCANT